MALAQPVYLLTDQTLTLSMGVVHGTSLMAETDPQFVERNVGKEGSVIYTFSKPPKLTLKIPNQANINFDTAAIQDGKAVGTFTLTSDLDSATSTIASLQTKFPVTGGSKGVWVWGKKSTEWTPEGDSILSIEIQPNCLNPAA